MAMAINSKWINLIHELRVYTKQKDGQNNKINLVIYCLTLQLNSIELEQMFIHKSSTYE